MFEEGLLLPLLSVEDLQAMFEISRARTERLFAIFHEPEHEQELISAYEVLSVAIFTTEDSPFAVARRLLLLFGASTIVK